MRKTAVSPQKQYLFWLLLVLLTAVFLRLFALTQIPPGLTHDEADHGLTAWSIVNGARALYFTIGYGREPLYDYATALLMGGMGRTFLAGRLTAVFFSLLMLSGMAAWVRRAFDGQTAVLATAFLAVSFWPLMTARQMLRSETLPALFVLALALFWRGLEQEKRQRLFSFAAGGILLGLTFYTYIPARILWLVFPAVVAYLFWQKRPFARRLWLPTLFMLAVALLMALPLLLYLVNNPGAESRIGQLSQPLMAAANGDLSLLGRHVIEGFGIIAFTGDSYWRYNIAGRPLLPPLTAALFLIGLGLAVWWAVRGRKMGTLKPAAAFLAVVWLLLGLSPALVTGARLSTTQTIGMQPVLYLFPALALRQGLAWLAEKRPEWQRGAWTAAVLLVLLNVVFTFYRYVNVWANQPDVRVEYETTLVTAMANINEHDGSQTAVSTITPDPVHSPAVAALTARRPDELRWFDARASLLLPAGETSRVILPGFTPLNDALTPYFETAVLADRLPLRETDHDRPLDIYRINGETMRANWATRFTTDEPVMFGENAILLGYDLHTPTVQPGDVVSLATWWEAKRPFADGVIFSQLLGPDGLPLAQADRLDAPSALWQNGDQFIQLHQFTLPPETAPGEYSLIVGVYQCPETCPAQTPPVRLPVSANAANDYWPLATLIVIAP